MLLLAAKRNLLFAPLATATGAPLAMTLALMRVRSPELELMA